MDDEVIMRLKIQEELAAIRGDGMVDEEGAFQFNLHEPMDVDKPINDENVGVKKLGEFPELESTDLGARIAKYKSAALKRKGSLKQAEDRLVEEKCKDHELLGCSMSGVPPTSSQ